MRHSTAAFLLSSIATLPLACRSTGTPELAAGTVDGSRSTDSADARELERALAHATNMVALDNAVARAPDRTDERRWPFFVQANRNRWNLELDASRVPPNTVYAQVSPTEEGGTVREYLIFDEHSITWWFDGRDDAYSEFKDPAVRREVVTSLFRAVFDGRSKWVPLGAEGGMPLDRGLALGIELVDGRQRFW